MSIQLVDGRTALLVPFRLPAGRTRTDWAAGLLARRMPGGGDGEGTPMWTLCPDRPMEVLDLFPEFHDSLLAAHWSGAADSVDPEKGSIALKLDERLVERYTHAEIVTNNNEYEITLSGVDIVVGSHGVGVLVLRIDYGSHGDPRMAIRTLIAARHLHSEGGVCGWVFKREHGTLPQGRVPETDDEQGWLDTVGEFAGEVRSALHDGMPAGKPLEPVRLGTLANWLLLGAHEKPVELDPVAHGAAIRAGKDLPAQARIELTRFARHQSAFVLEGELSPEVQTRLLYHLGRAYKDDYLVPSESDALDVVLRPRRNRIIGVSREGAASISWMESGANEVLEVYQWPAKFLDFYLYLHIHVLSERIALSNCAYELARGAEKLGVLRTMPGNSEQAAMQMQELAGRVSRAFLRATGSDTGGSSEYQHFYRGLRQVHDSARVVDEVRQRLADLDSLGGGWSRAGETLLAHERFLEAFEMDREERRLDRQERQRDRKERDVERTVLEREPAEREGAMSRMVAMAGFFLIVFSLLHMIELLFPQFMRMVTREPVFGMTTLFIVGYLAWRVTRRMLPGLRRPAPSRDEPEPERAT